MIAAGEEIRAGQNVEFDLPTDGGNSGEWQVEISYWFLSRYGPTLNTVEIILEDVQAGSEFTWNWTVCEHYCPECGCPAE